jgi:hypothetical protein
MAYRREDRGRVLRAGDGKKVRGARTYDLCTKKR